MSCHILFVEDEDRARRSFAILLQRANHKVAEAETGEAAVELIAGNHFDVVISDFRLPGALNGIDVLKHQNEKFPGKRLILLTGFGSIETQLQAQALGAVYMEKPVPIGELLSNIGALRTF